MKDLNEIRAELDKAGEQLAQVSGGSCTANDIEGVIGNLKETYDNLVEFTSYVMERVAGQ